MFEKQIIEGFSTREKQTFCLLMLLIFIIEFTKSTAKFWIFLKIARILLIFPSYELDKIVLVIALVFAKFLIRYFLLFYKCLNRPKIDS